jgi:hypothetical protein
LASNLIGDIKVLFNFISAEVFLAAALVSILGYFLLKFLPNSVKLYTVYIQIALAATLLLSIFGLGYKYSWSTWQTEKNLIVQANQALKLKNSQLETKSAEVTTKIVTEYVDRVKIIEKRGQEIVKLIPEFITVKDDSECRVPDNFVRLHNFAATNSGETEISETSTNANGTSPEVKISEVAEVVINNYKDYYVISERLRKLQSWVIEQETIYNSK